MSGHVLRLKSIKPLGEYRVAAVEYIKLFEDEKNFTTSWRVIREEKCCITDRDGTTECKYLPDSVLLENANREDAIAEVQGYQLEGCCKELERDVYELSYIKQSTDSKEE